MIFRDHDLFAFELRKTLGDIRLQNNNVGSLRIMPRVLSTFTLREIVFGTHLSLFRLIR